MKQKIAFTTVQIKRDSLAHLSLFQLEQGDLISIEDIRQKSKNTKRFMLRFFSQLYPNGVIVPIGYDNPQFMDIEQFIKTAKNYPDQELQSVSDSMIRDAKTALNKGRNIAFMSEVFYGFTSAGYLNSDLTDPVMYVGLDCDGYYILTNTEQKYYIYSAKSVEESHAMLN